MEKFYDILTLISIGTYYLLVAIITTRVVFKRQAVSVSLAWLMIIYMLPFIGIFVYFLFGELNLGRKRAERSKNMFAPYGEWFSQLQTCQAHCPQVESIQLSQIHHLCKNRTAIPSLSGNQLSLQNTPDDILLSIMKDIREAKHTIRIEFYIWESGGRVDDITHALIEAAQRGVQVDILIDSAGSPLFFKSQAHQTMLDAGIVIRQALKVNAFRLFFRRLDLRLHRKIITIDDAIAYTGSMNMVDPAFFKQQKSVGQWIDIMVRITGPTVNILSAIHAWDWEVETGERLLPSFPECKTDNNNVLQPIQVVPSGPGMPENLIQQVLLLAINQARQSIRITTPYFVPSDYLLQALKMTAQRGVDVEIILPKKNDSLLVNWASRSFFSDLLTNGVKIYQFDGGLLHTKSVVIDQNYCLLGSVNLDMRSLWLNFELTLVIDDPTFTQELNNVQQTYLQQSTPVSLNDWKQRPLSHRILERFFYLFNPLL